MRVRWRPDAELQYAAIETVADLEARRTCDGCDRLPARPVSPTRFVVLAARAAVAANA